MTLEPRLIGFASKNAAVRIHYELMILAAKKILQVDGVTVEIVHLGTYNLEMLWCFISCLDLLQKVATVPEPGFGIQF